MAYIGASPASGEFKKLDDISSQFNNSNVTFTLQAGGSDVTIGSAQNIIISVDGVVQEPGVAYTVSGSNIEFTEAPNTSSTFFGVLLGAVGEVTTLTDDTVTTAKIVNSAVTTAKIADANVTTAKLSTTGVTATTYGNTTTTAVFTVGVDGRITSASNVAIALPAAGGSGLFNTSISTASAANVDLTFANVYAAPADSGFRYIVHSLHVTNINGTDDAEISAQILGSTYSSISLGNTIPVPAGSSVELLKKPKILQPNDAIQMLGNTSSGNVHVTVTLESSDDTDYFGGGIDLTTATTYTDLHTATANSVIESILVSNDDQVNDAKVRVVWTDGSDNIQGYYAYDLIIPADATVEILEQPKFLQNGYKIRVYANVGDRVEAMIAGKAIT